MKDRDSGSGSDGSGSTSVSGVGRNDGFEFYRHGTLSLYAALDVKTGKVAGKAAKRHTSTDFIAFLNQLLSKARWAKHIHIVLDNLSADKTQAVAASESAPSFHAYLFVLAEPSRVVVRRDPA